MYNLGHQMAPHREAGGGLVYPWTYSIISMLDTTALYWQLLANTMTHINVFPRQSDLVLLGVKTHSPHCHFPSILNAGFLTELHLEYCSILSRISPCISHLLPDSFNFNFEDFRCACPLLLLWHMRNRSSIATRAPITLSEIIFQNALITLGSLSATHGYVC